MVRIPIATRESVPETQQAAFDAMVERSGTVPRNGPGSVMVHVPEAGRLANQLSNYLRNESTLPSKIQELAMLVVAREAGLPAHLERPCRVGTPGRSQRCLS